jgi:hypothetical protein
MKPSAVASKSSAAFSLFSLGSLAMMVLSSVVYLFSGDSYRGVPSHWLVLTGWQWMIWAVVFGGLAIAATVISSGLAKSEAAEARLRQEQIQAEQAAAEASQLHQQNQSSLRRTLADANSSALASLDCLPGHLETANEHLRQAEIDWKERVFNPFWTSIEGCACSLANFKSEVSNIEVQSQRFANAARQFEGRAEPFAVSAISVAAMQSFKATSDHMAQFTRRAQGDIDFANIFEMWRGNAIMESGFASLRSAISSMGRDIAGQIASLGSSIGSLSQSIDSNTRQVSDAISHQTALATLQHNESQATRKQSLNHEKIVADRLRNIENGYKPMFG